MFSSEITQEVAFSKNVSFVSLDDDSLKWAREILGYKNAKRFDCISTMKQKGYDLHTEVKVLEAFYKRLVA